MEDQYKVLDELKARLEAEQRELEQDIETSEEWFTLQRQIVSLEAILYQMTFPKSTVEFHEDGLGFIGF